MARRRLLSGFLGLLLLLYVAVLAARRPRRPSAADAATAAPAAPHEAPPVVEAPPPSRATATPDPDAEPWQRGGEPVDGYLRRRALNGTLFLVPVNEAYLDFGLNLLCSLRAAGRFRGPGTTVGRGFVFVAMDSGALRRLAAARLPVFTDPGLPFVSERSTSWHDPKFHRLVCTKLLPALRVLRLGLRLIHSDADIAVRRDPYPYFANRAAGLDLLYQIGSCHHELPDGFDFTAGDGVAKLNTGFYVAQPTAGVRGLFERAREHCAGSATTGDQPAINHVIQQDLRAAQQADQGRRASPAMPRPVATLAYQYGFLDGCLFANGCTQFKHLCAGLVAPDPLRGIYTGAAVRKLKLGRDEALPSGTIRRDDPVLVHANFVIGRKAKLKHLRQEGLWDDGCVASWGVRLP